MNSTQIVQTILAAHQVGATQEQRTAEVQVFQQLKDGDIRASAGIGSELTQPTQPLEAQVLGYGLLQYLVGVRWEDFPAEDRASLPNISYALVHQNASAPWVIRSKSAALLALVIKRSGPDILKSGLAQLLDEASRSGPGFQEAACLVLRYIADDILQFTDDLAGEQLRTLITTLTDILVHLLQFVERAIETNFPLIASSASPNDAKLHIAAVRAALGVFEVYAEWAPLAHIKQSGLVTACGYMLQEREFRNDACIVFSKLVSRKLTANEDFDAFSATMGEMAGAFMQVTGTLLSPESNPAQELNYEGDHDEFGLLLCEAMAVLGTNQILLAFPDTARRMTYLQYMLAFAQHPYLLLADKSLALWMKLLQDAAHVVESSGKGVASGNTAMNTTTTGAGGDVQIDQMQGQIYGKENVPGDANRTRESALPPEAVVALMELAAEHLQNRNPHVPQAEDQVPVYFDSFEDYKEFMIGYRLKLSSIVKAAAAVLPEQAIRAAFTRLHAALTACSSGQNVDQARVLLESAVVFTCSAIKAVWDAALVIKDDSERAARMNSIISATEPMFQGLLALQTTDPLFLQSQARGLEAFARLVAARWDLLPDTISRIFVLLVDAIPMEPQGHLQPPAIPPSDWKEGLQARADIANLFLEYAKAAPQAFLPHLETIARRLTELWDAQKLRPGEKNTITEALLAASMSGPLELQVSLVDWALSPIRNDWSLPEWQARVSNPEAFLRYYMPINLGPPVTIGAQQERWLIYHQVHMVERSMRRMQYNTQQQYGSHQHPLIPHLAWAIPSLLKLISSLNAVFCPAGQAALGPAVGAIDMSPQERALYLRRGHLGRRSSVMNSTAMASSAAITGTPLASQGQPIPSQPPPQQQLEDHGEYASVGGITIGSLRSWIRHVREFSYHTLGLLPICVPGALDLPGISPSFAPSILAYMESLSHQNLRLVLRHITIPYVKNLPIHCMVDWMLPQLSLITPHMQQRLAAAWTTISALPHIEIGDPTSGATNEEIINERMVRELTQEYADLLKEVAGRVLEEETNSQYPSKESQQPPNGAAPTGTTTTTSITSTTVVGSTKPGKSVVSGRTLLELLLEREPAAGIAAAAAAVQGMQLSDDAAYRFAMFSRTLVVLGPRDPQLYNFVGSEVLKAAITSLGSEVMSTHQSDILGLLRSILVQQLSDVNSQVHNVLLSLPGVTIEKEAALVQAFQKVASEKEHRNKIKRFLVDACGRGSFAALAEWKPPSTLPVGALRNRGGRAPTASTVQHQEQAKADEQLQGDITRALFS